MDDIECLEAALGREQRKLQLVRDIGLGLGSTLDLDELLTLIVENVTELMEARRSTIFVVSDDGTELWSRVAQGEGAIEIRLDVGSGIAGWVAANNKTLNVTDAYSDQRFDPEWDKLTGFKTESILCVPMQNKDGTVIGVLQVLNKASAQGFTEDDEVFLQAVAGQAAVSLENSHLVRTLMGSNEELRLIKTELEQRNSELDLLLELEKLTSSARDLEDLLARVLNRASELCDADAGAALLLDPSSDNTRFDAAFGGQGQELRRFHLKGGEGIAGWVTQHNEAVRVLDASADPRHSKSIAALVGYDAGSLLCVPLRGREQVLGALELLNKRGGNFSDGDEKLLTLIAGHIVRAVELTRERESKDREERLATIGHLLSGVLHDLKTPMTVISGYVQLMAATSETEQRQSYASMVLKQFEHIGTMTAEILAFARGESKILLRKVYIHRFIEEIGELVRRELEPHGIEVTFELEYKGVARFDEGKIRRVFHNISRNAAEAMPDGGSFVITVTRQDEDLMLRFADTGTGIPLELEGRLFESFATAGKEGGTGLGLAVVKKIIDDHQGSIAYESAPGEGTTFTIQLPLRVPPT